MSRKLPNGTTLVVRPYLDPRDPQDAARHEARMAPVAPPRPSGIDRPWDSWFDSTPAPKPRPRRKKAARKVPPAKLNGSAAVRAH